MSLPRVAIVGRPNVGKSSILNMLAKRKVSIVDDVPGVTRDRVATVAELEGPLKTETPKQIEIIDTGGYGVYVSDGRRFDDAGEDLTRLTDDIETQIAAAVDHADHILFIIDAQAGVTAIDEAIAKLLRERALGGVNKAAIPITVVANKVDADNWEPYGLEAAALGFGEPWLVSAKTNFRRRDFIERLFKLLPYDITREGEAPEDQRPPDMLLAIVGKRNAGKSTFVNALAGEERVIVSEIAGTTRDAIDVRFQLEGRSLIAIDTAGVRKRSKFADRVEYWAFDRCQRAIARADVALLLLDATQRISAIDKRLGKLLVDRCKPAVIVVTKWDLVEGRPNRKGQPVSIEDYRDYFNKEMPGLSFAPIVFTAAKDHRRGVTDAVDIAFELFQQATTRVATGHLNQFFKDIIARRGPSSSLGTRAKILFATQVKTNPPTIVLVVNKPKLFDERYMRYLMNRIREELPFEEIPVRLLVRERRRAELGDLLSGEHQREQRLAIHLAAAERATDAIPEIDPELEINIDDIDNLDADIDLDDFFATDPNKSEAPTDHDRPKRPLGSRTPASSSKQAKKNAADKRKKSNKPAAKARAKQGGKAAKQTSTKRAGKPKHSGKKR